MALLTPLQQVLASPVTSAHTAALVPPVALISLELAPPVASAHIVLASAVSACATAVEAPEVSARSVVVQVASAVTATEPLVALAQAVVVKLRGGPILVESAFVARSFSEACYSSAISYI